MIMMMAMMKMIWDVRCREIDDMFYAPAIMIVMMMMMKMMMRRMKRKMTMELLRVLEVNYR